MPQYKLKEEETVVDFGKVEKENFAEKILSDFSVQFEEKIKSYLKSHSEINMSENDLLPLKNLILKNCDKCGNFEIAEIPNFEKNLKEHAVGNFIKFKQFLHLRRLVKNLLSALDNLNSEESGRKRQDLYKQIFNFMSKNGMNWWD